MLNTCVIIGAGNVASHLARSLSPFIRIKQVFSRRIEHAEELAQSLPDSPVAIADADALDCDADLYLMAVTDDSIPEILDKTKCCHGIWAHTSGSVDISVFEGRRERYGVFYPLQTFSKDKAVDMNVVPMFIEASDREVENELIALASLVSGNVKPLDSEGRRRLHIAAVFACNFVNYMWVVADRELRKCGTDIRALAPLLRETVEKINTLTPLEAQTGPARRGDIKVMDSHMRMLHGGDAQLYELISQQIYNTYHEQD